MNDGTNNPTDKPVSPINGQPIPVSTGRPKGTPNKATTQAREAIARFVDANTERLQGWLDDIAKEDPLAAFECVTKIIEYHVPKLQRTDVQALDKDGKPSDGMILVIQERAN